MILSLLTRLLVLLLFSLQHNTSGGLVAGSRPGLPVQQSSDMESTLSGDDDEPLDSRPRDPNSDDAETSASQQLASTYPNKPQPGNKVPLTQHKQAAYRTAVGKRSRGSKPHGHKDFVPKPRGAVDGPLRTPLHIGDAWQREESYAVDKVTPPILSICVLHFFPYFPNLFLPHLCF